MMSGIDLELFRSEQTDGTNRLLDALIPMIQGELVVASIFWPAIIATSITGSNPEIPKAMAVGALSLHLLVPLFDHALSYLSQHLPVNFPEI